MDEIARLTPSFTGVSYKKLDELGSIQWPCNDEAPDGTPTMHIDHFVRGKGKFIITQYVGTSEKVTRKYPLILTTGRILSQYNVGAQTRRTRTAFGTPRTASRSTRTTRRTRHQVADDWVGIESRAGSTVLRALVTERMQPGVVYTTFHFPESGANVITTENSDWATNCPEYKVTAVQVMPVQQPSEWQREYQRFNETQLQLADANALPVGGK
jgi:formate dehydrogenase major subunit